MQFLRDELQEFADHSDKFEKVKYSFGVEYYRDTWASRLTTELDDTQSYNTSNALEQCYDRPPREKTNANIGKGEGVAITNRS